jgi:hypothetical protein
MLKIVEPAYPLAPVAFMPDVAASFFAPIAGNPDSTRMRRATINTVDPYIMMSIPAMISRCPDISRAGRWHDFNRTRRGRANADDNLCICSPNCKEKCAGCGEELLLHRYSPFQTAPG